VTIRRALLAATCFALACGSHGADAADKVRAAKAVGVVWAFIPLDVGVEEGIFARYGIDLDIAVMAGEAKLQQALTADSVDVGLAGSPGAALAVKGAPVTVVAALDGEPRNYSVVVAADSAIKTVADLKGKLISVATSGSLPQWLVQRLGVGEGWGADGIRTVALGSPDASLSATLTHQVDGLMTTTEQGYLLEDKNEARIITGMGRYAPHFHTQVVFARQDFVHDHPDTLARFLKGLYASIAFMKANKGPTVDIATRVMHQSPAVMGRTYDYEIGMLSDDGSFDPQAIEVLKDSFLAMGMLDAKPRDDQILTRQFVPVKP
jgi:ABC-type nitrate/sulfonate/bicarbonate transport system substrate-binding protein